jgi:uncharacterized membrane protein
MASLIQGLVGLVILILGIPLLLGKVPPNSLYGLRTQKTLDDEQIWYQANRFAGATLAWIPTVGQGLTSGCCQC